MKKLIISVDMTEQLLVVKYKFKSFITLWNIVSREFFDKKYGKSVNIRKYITK